MAGFNKVILIGNLTRDPELRYTPQGTAIARFTLAMNRNWKTDTGEQREETTFVDVDAFGRRAEVICQYLKKGKQFMVEGRLKQDSWEDKQTGQKRSKLGVVLEGFTFIDRGGEGEGGHMSGGASHAPRAGQVSSPRASVQEDPSSQYDNLPPEDDDVPF